MNLFLFVSTLFVLFIALPPTNAETLLYSVSNFRNITVLGKIYALFPNGTSRYVTDGDWPRISPDGRYMLFKKTRTKKDVFPAYTFLSTYDFVTGEERNVFNQNPGVGYAFLADSNRIIADDDLEVVIVYKNGTFVGRYAGNSGATDNPSANPTNLNEFIFSDDKELYTWEFNATELIPPNLGMKKYGSVSLINDSYVHPVWHPNGSFVACVRNDSNTLDFIYPTKNNILPFVGFYPTITFSLNGSYLYATTFTNVSSELVKISMEDPKDMITISPTTLSDVNLRYNAAGSVCRDCADVLCAPGEVCKDIGVCLSVCRQISCDNTPSLCGPNSVCTKILNGSYICACNPAYYGNPYSPTGCILSSNCGDDKCEQNETCATCPQDCCPNLCANVKCGKNAFCQPGNGICACNESLVGDPDLGCSTCGDGICNATVGEDCSTCPSDCREQNCHVCGDGVCDSTESCSSCFIDCSRSCATAPKPCPGNPPCSGHGKCDNGLCFCDPNFSGVSCDQVPQPINATKNDTNPNIIFSPTNNNNVTFQFAIYEIREIDSTGKAIVTLDLRKENYTITTNTKTNANQPTYVLSSGLSNRARLTIRIFVFDTQTTLSFAGENLTFSANSIKVEIAIQGWPFSNYRNSLWLMSSQNSPANGITGCQGGQQYDASGNLRYSQIQINDLILYGRYLEYAAIDSRKKQLQVKVVAQSPNNITVATVIPFFFESAVIDPDFSVLVASEESQREIRDGCQIKKKDNAMRNVVIGVVVGVVGTAFIFAVVLYAYKKHRRHKARKVLRDVKL